MERTNIIALLAVITVVIVVVLYASFIIYMTWPISTYTVDKAGVFGDSFGILTAIFSGLAFAGVVWTVLTQLEELRITRYQLKNQGIENAFFQMLRLHNEILNEISLHAHGHGTVLIKGRDVIKILSKHLKNSYISINTNEIELSEREKAVEAYKQFWKERNPELAHYYRFLFNILIFINESEADKEFSYATLVRAQLSNQELTLLFYYCLSAKGERFIKYAEKYSIFDNLTEHDLMTPCHMEFMSDKALGK
jgi:hypothetical protein